MPAAWVWWTICSRNAMVTRGYNSYRGRNKWRPVLMIALVVVLLAAVGFLIIQNYLVYDDAGKAHWEFPFMQQDQDGDRTPAIDPDEVEIDRKEPVSTVGKNLTPLQAQELPLWCLGDDPAWLLTDAPESVVVNVKTVDGSLAYASGVAAPEGVLRGGETTLPHLRTILDSDHRVVARMACLCDNSYAYAMTEEAALCREDGSLWWDDNGRYWLDPAKAGTREYVTALCQEYVSLGFDEIVLDYFAYPAEWEGEADRAAVLQQFITDLRAALPEGTRVSVLLRELPDAKNGLTAELLNKSFDRVYTNTRLDGEALKKMLPDDFDTAVRLVPLVWTATESGSYMIPAN